LNTNTLIHIARASIDSVLSNSNYDIETLVDTNRYLSEIRASFVTLHLNDDLRGCIGSIYPTKKLVDDIWHNAKAAAFRDYRFTPITKDEFSKISIEVSVLSLPKTLEYKNIDDLKNKITKNDGVILSLNGNSATYLPQVWQEVSGFEEFFSTLCTKAGLPENGLNRYPEIKTYRVEVFCEH
jgi:AmmeMemoRadiSam system protein A